MRPPTPAIFSIAIRATSSRDAMRLMAPSSRRQFLQRGASLGALVMLTGCDIQTGNSIETHAARRVALQ